MFSAILCGPIWVEILSSMVGKALLTGGLTVIKAGPEIKKLINSVNEKDQNEDQKEISPKVIDVFNRDIK